MSIRRLVAKDDRQATGLRRTATATGLMLALSTAIAPAAMAADAAPVAAAAPVAVAAAESWPMRWEIGMGLGFNYLHEYNFLGNGGALEDRPESGGIFAVRVLGWVLDNVGLEIEGKLLPTSYRNSRGGSATVIGARAQVLYSFLPLADIRPFISAGGGMEIFKAANSKAALEKSATYSLESDQDWTTLLGAGVQWQFMHRLGLRFDGRWAPSAGKTAALTKLKTAESAMAHNVEATVALQYTLGGKPGDSDLDGILDGKDRCEEQAEDRDGFQDEDGCPDLDNDADGIPDAKDKCPNAAETKNGFEDEDGCADENPDLDKDGVPDSSDKCPDKPETKNGFEDSDGCPDVVPAALKKFAGAIKGIEFEVGSAKIIAKSFPVLDGAVKVLKEFPDTKIEVSGHTDNSGDAEVNKKLSQERAESVKAYLVEKGVASERVTTVGFGPDKPVADNKNKAGQAKNRRIEFKLL